MITEDPVIASNALELIDTHSRGRNSAATKNPLAATRPRTAATLPRTNDKLWSTIVLSPVNLRLLLDLGLVAFWPPPSVGRMCLTVQGCAPC